MREVKYHPINLDPSIQGSQSCRSRRRFAVAIPIVPWESSPHVTMSGSMLVSASECDCGLPSLCEQPRRHASYVERKANAGKGQRRNDIYPAIGRNFGGSKSDRREKRSGKRVWLHEEYAYRSLCAKDMSKIRRRRLIICGTRSRKNCPSLEEQMGWKRGWQGRNPDANVLERAVEVEEDECCAVHDPCFLPVWDGVVSISNHAATSQSRTYLSFEFKPWITLL